MTVSDTDSGIPEKDRDRIFEAFSQAESSTRRGVEGTGLGLSVSRQLARLMGGDLTLAPPPRQGSRFDVRLPVRTRQLRPGDE